MWRLMIRRVKEGTKEHVAEKQGGFRIKFDQIFALKQLVEKYREKR